MRPRTLFIALIALTMLVGATGVMGCGKKPEEAGPAEEEAIEVVQAPPTPVSVSTAVRAPIKETIRATGTIAAVREVNIVPEGGGIVTRVYADIGDRVTKGSLLVAMGTDILSAQARQADAGVAAARARVVQAKDTVDLTGDTTGINVEQAQKQLESAQTQLDKALTGAETTETSVNNGIRQAKIGVQQAETSLADVRRGAREQQIAQAKSQVEMAKATYDLAKSQYDVKKRLYTQGAASGTEFGESLAQFQGARSQLEQAEEALDLVKEGATTEQIRLAELQLEQANEQLQQAESQRDQITLAQEDVKLARTQVRLAEDQVSMAKAGRGEVKVRAGDVEAAEAGLRQAQASSDLAHLMVGKNYVRSPITGLVTTRFIDPGEQAGNQDPVFMIVDISTVYIEAVIGESQVAQLHEGHQATVTVKGLANAEFTGHIVDINPASIPGQRNFIARILVQNEGEILRPGMSADVALDVSENAGAVLVSVDAIVEDRDVRKVYTVVDNVVDVREVQVGASERGQVEVISGIEPGDMVVVAGQADLAHEERVEPIQRTGGI